VLIPWVVLPWVLAPTARLVRPTAVGHYQYGRSSGIGLLFHWLRLREQEAERHCGYERYSHVFFFKVFTISQHSL
jgi:hypothetical protein